MDDPEATKLMLEALSDIRGKVSDIHHLLFDAEDSDGEAEEEDA